MTDAERHRRLDICRTCPHYTEHAGRKRCGAASPNYNDIRLKTEKENAVCPTSRWVNEAPSRSERVKEARGRVARRQLDERKRALGRP